MAGEAAGAAGNLAGGFLNVGLEPGLRNKRQSHSFYDPTGAGGTGHDPTAAMWGGSPTGLRDYSANLNVRRGLAEGRTANTADYGQANQQYGNADWDRMQAGNARNRQVEAADLMRARAMGQVPSIAEQVGRRQMGQAVASQGGIAASARGPGGLALAGQVQAGNVAGLQSGISNQTQINAAQERNQAEQNFMGAYSGIRQGDQAQGGLSLAAGGQQAQNAQFQAMQEQANRNANDQRAMGYEQLDYGAQNAQLGAKMQEQGILGGSYNASENANAQTAQANANRKQSVWDKLTTSLSDENTKMPAQMPGLAQGTKILDTATGPVDRFGFSPAQQREFHDPGASDPMGALKAHSDYATQYVNDPGATSMYSDTRAKEAALLAKGRQQGMQLAKGGRGPIEPGNIEHFGRDEIDNGDGTTSTVRSMSFNDGPGREVLVPTAFGGRINSDDESIANYRRTGEHMGIFRTPEEATAHAKRIHDDYEKGKYKQSDKDFIKRGYNPSHRPSPAMLDDRAQQHASRQETEDLNRALGQRVAQDKTMTGQEITDAEYASRSPEQKNIYTQGSSLQDNARGLAPGTSDFERTGPKDAPTKPWWASTGDSLLSDDRAKQQAFFDGQRYSAEFDQAANIPGRKRVAQLPAYMKDAAITEPTIATQPPPTPKRNPVAFHHDTSAEQDAQTHPFTREPNGKPREMQSFTNDRQNPIADANRSMQGTPYAYKPGFETASGQAPGEVNVGPMAQNLEKSPVAATAVKTDPITGLKVIDKDKALKVMMSGISDLQRQQDETQSQLSLAKGGRKRK